MFSHLKKCEMYLFRTKICILGFVWHRKRELDWEKFDQTELTKNRSNSFRMFTLISNGRRRRSQLSVTVSKASGVRCAFIVLLRLRNMNKPSLIPENHRFSKATHGKVPGARGQIRY